MKKILFAVVAVLLLLCPLEAFARSYEVNPFYAIRSYPEYQKVQGLLGDSNNIYYGWSRIARDSAGNIVFTGSKDSLSRYDIYSGDYSVPEPVDGKLTNEINEDLHPGSKNLMMVFFNRVAYDDGRDSIIEFLNMESEEWKDRIIGPMVECMGNYGFDGIVLDIEGISDSYLDVDYTASLNSGLKEKYNMFLKDVRSMLKGKELVVCANTPHFGGYDYTYIYNIADKLLLLTYPYQHYTTYDESDGVPELAGRIKEVDVPEAEPYGKIKSDLDSVISTLTQRYGASLDAGKILLGTTLEVTGWVEKEYIHNSKTYTYYEASSCLDADSSIRASSLEKINSINAPREYVAVSPVYKYESRTYKKTIVSGLDSGMKKVEYYYDTPETIYEKYYRLVSDYNLGGISVWRLGLGDYSPEYGIWSSLNYLFSFYKGDFDELPYVSDTASDKTWTVKFNSPLDEDTIKLAVDSIAVVDEYGRLAEVQYRYDSLQNSIIISPYEDYKPGGLYYLIIGKNIKSTGGSSMTKPMVMRFRIKTEE